MKTKSAWLPWVVTGVLALWVLLGLAPRPEPGFQIREFGRLPTLLNGRVQPLDSVARNCLLQIRNKQTAPIKLHFSIWRADRRGEMMPAINWLLEVMARPELADSRKVFRIDHPELISMLKLPDADPGRGEDGKHFSFDQLKPSLSEIERQVQRIGPKDEGTRTVFEKQTMKLYQGLLLYHRLKNSLKPEDVPDLAADVDAYRQAIPAGVEAVRAREAGQAFNQDDFNRILQHMNRYDLAARAAYPLIVPPADPAHSRDAWESMGTSLMEAVHNGSLHPATLHYAAMATAYVAGKPDEFNRAVAGYRQWLGQNLAPELRKARGESVFNGFEPFYKATVLYVLVFLLVCFYWFKLADPLRRSALYLLGLAFIVHTIGLFARMALEGRPPVTNLYSSAIFIGWGAVLLGLFLERFYRNGIGVATAAGIGFATQVIAHNLAVGGDTMEMMRAVLDSNFWLATHVVAITIGYSSTFVAGFLGLLFILLGVFTRALTGDMARSIGRMIYGIVCFATLFSFVGTILGGIWADQSWGRFWGWDPKENGALIIVLWNAVILHLRWGNLIKDRGLAVAAVFGNIVTSFSWFGVNMLGVGLHSYGFMEAAFTWLMLFMASQILIIGDGLLAERCWSSLQPAGPTKCGWVRGTAAAFNVVILGMGIVLNSYWWYLIAIGVFLGFVFVVSNRGVAAEAAASPGLPAAATPLSGGARSASPNR